MIVLALSTPESVRGNEQCLPGSSVNLGQQWEAWWLSAMCEAHFYFLSASTSVNWVM